MVNAGAGPGGGGGGQYLSAVWRDAVAQVVEEHSSYIIFAMSRPVWRNN